MNQIKEGRIKAGLSQDDLAVKMGYDRTTIAKWESDARTPSFEQLKKLSMILSLDIAEMSREDLFRKKFKVELKSSKKKHILTMVQSAVLLVVFCILVWKLVTERNTISLVFEILFLVTVHIGWIFVASLFLKEKGRLKDDRSFILWYLYKNVSKSEYQNARLLNNYDLLKYAAELK